MDKDYWQLIITGDHVAYEALYAEYFRKFYNFGRKFTADSALVEDSIQEVFLEVWFKRQHIANLDSPKAYFFSTFRFILLKKLKDRHAHKDLSDDAAEPDFSVEQVIINNEVNKETAEKLQASINGLTARQREAIFLRFYEGLSYEEVAAVMNISVKASYKVVARSLLALREHIKVLLYLTFYHAHS